MFSLLVPCESGVRVGAPLKAELLWFAAAASECKGAGAALWPSQVQVPRPCWTRGAPAPWLRSSRREAGSGALQAEPPSPQVPGPGPLFVEGKAGAGPRAAPVGRLQLSLELTSKGGGPAGACGRQPGELRFGLDISGRRSQASTGR